MPEFFFDKKLYYNPVEFAMDRIGGTWKMPILWRLQNDTLRYSELKKALPRITHKMLSAELRNLENEGFVTRTAYPGVPPRVEYALTPRGVAAIPIIRLMRDYGMRLMEEFGVEAHAAGKRP
jgi:DNA-binding HxlR family transcriptional regulator